MQIPEKNELLTALLNSKSLRGIGSKFGVTHHVVKKWLQSYNIEYNSLDSYSYDNCIGKKYGLLTILSLKTQGARQRKYAECICDCGNHKTVRIDGLKYGSAVSCGCHARNRYGMRGNKNPSYAGVGEIYSSHYSQMKRDAIKRNKEWALTKEYIWNLYIIQDRKCALTGLPIKFGRYRIHHETTASLDRIDSAKGYIEGNVQWVMKDINMLKGILDDEYLIKLANLIALRHPRTKEQLIELFGDSPNKE